VTGELFFMNTDKGEVVDRLPCAYQLQPQV
jgi:hypothetical protein